MLLDKFQYLPGNAWVGTDVTIIHFPVAQLFHLCILGWHDANSDLRRLAQVRTVERNRRNWPTPQSLPSFLSQALNQALDQRIQSMADVAAVARHGHPGQADRSPVAVAEPVRREADRHDPTGMS